MNLLTLSRFVPLNQDEASLLYNPDAILCPDLTALRSQVFAKRIGIGPAEEDDASEMSQTQLLSLKDILLKRVGQDQVESYIMLSSIASIGGFSQTEQRDYTLIVKRMHLTFYDQDCTVLNFSDITAIKRLK